MLLPTVTNAIVQERDDVSAMEKSTVQAHNQPIIQILQLLLFLSHILRYMLLAFLVRDTVIQELLFLIPTCL
jgi:hypothetical protein